MSDRVRVQVRVGGVVQGVGFRPFTHGLAKQLGLAGFVSNDSNGVLAEVEGTLPAVAAFVRRLREDAPPLALVESVTERSLAPTGERGFTIAASQAGSARRTLVSPDMATCADCLRELFDPTDRRHRYPFINCTNCGPRFTIVTDVPYDRPATTMAASRCAPTARGSTRTRRDRRFHAQPVCCPACGPRLRCSTPEAALAGGVGEHAATRPDRGSGPAAGRGCRRRRQGPRRLPPRRARRDETAVAALRSRKHREDKPFAVLAPDLAAAARPWPRSTPRGAGPDGPAARSSCCRAGRVRGARAARASVAPGNRYVPGCCSPTPRCTTCSSPRSAPDRADQRERVGRTDRLPRRRRLAGSPDRGRLPHPRPGDPHPRRRLRRPGGARPRAAHPPLPRLRPGAARPAGRVRRPVLGCGAELKSTFCLARGPHAFLSHHIGDLENAETLRSFTEGVAHYRRLFDVEPAVVAHDLHPEYLSTKYALELAAPSLETVGRAAPPRAPRVVPGRQRRGRAGHRAGLRRPGLRRRRRALGRRGHGRGPRRVPAPRRTWRRCRCRAATRRSASRGGWRRRTCGRVRSLDGADLAVARRNPARWTAVGRMADRAAGAATSVGRLFDAVAALVGVRDAVNYEGQAAIELEQAAATVWARAGPVPPTYRAGSSGPR